MSSAVYARVVMARRVRALKHPLTYSVPEELQATLKVGALADVPLGGSTSFAIVVETGVEPDIEISRIKPIRAVSDRPVISAGRVEFATRISRLYGAPLYSVLSLMFPGADDYSTVEYLKRAPFDLDALSGLDKLHRGAVGKLPPEGFPRSRFRTITGLKKADAEMLLERLLSTGLLHSTLKVMERIKPSPAEMMVWFRDAEREAEPYKGIRANAARQRAVINLLHFLNEPRSMRDVCELAEVDPPLVRGLVDKGVLRLFERSGEKTAEFIDHGPQVELNDEQRAVIDRAAELMETGEGGTLALFGVTASGKTEVYIQAASAALARGRSAVVLVPEIALTRQTMLRFLGSLPGRLEILHSGLTDVEKSAAWRRIRTEAPLVVLGPRSALFAPLDDVGLIVVDEEHETSYKQERHPRYHARRVAQMLAKKHNALLMLGSATPSLETFHAAIEEGSMELHRLKRRASGAELAEAEVIELNQVGRDKMLGTLSPALVTALEDNRNAGGKSILFLNQRGYARSALCSKCGSRLICPHCDVTLTYHLSGPGRASLACHHCGYTQGMPDRCPEEACQSPSLVVLGFGTQQVERDVRSILPDARIMRMDRDTVQGRDAVFSILDEFAREGDVLVGTQMIAKGLDIHDVTLVGVVLAEAPLFMPDFRSPERAFQLTVQVAGRAGRGEKGGRALVQTWRPDEYSLKHALNQDYEAFYAEEIEHRRKFFYPPFCHMLRILVSDPDAEKARDVSRELSDYLRSLKSREDRLYEKLLGPVPALVGKRQDLYRWHVLLKGFGLAGLSATARAVEEGFNHNSRFRIDYDLEPYSLT